MHRLRCHLPRIYMKKTIRKQSIYRDNNIEIVINQAICRFNLRQLGWLGFDALPWVQAIKAKYPQTAELAHTASSIRGGFAEQARELFEQATQEDRATIQAYFIGKLAVERLSCQLSGFGAGSCDKMGAFIQIWEISKEFVPAAQLSDVA